MENVLGMYNQQNTDLIVANQYAIQVLFTILLRGLFSQIIPLEVFLSGTVILGFICVCAQQRVGNGFVHAIQFEVSLVTFHMCHLITLVSGLP